MHIKKLNEELKKLLLEDNDYKLAIIEGRSRDLYGNLASHSIKAKNDVDALLYVFRNFDLQNAGYFNGEYDEEEIDEEELENKKKVLQAAETGENQEEALKILTDFYFQGFDPSDYYDNIVKLISPDGRVIFEDKNIHLDDEERAVLNDFDLEDEFHVEEPDIEIENKKMDLYNEVISLTDSLTVSLSSPENHSKYILRADFLDKETNERVGFLDINLGWDFDAHKPFTAMDDELGLEDRLLNGDLEELKTWLSSHYSK